MVDDGDKVKVRPSKKKPKCIICEENDAEYCIKNMLDTCYCKECAIDSFGDLDLLQKL